MIPWLEIDTPFPDITQALKKEQGADGLLAAGADLSPQRLLDAYRHGIFPWYSQGQPILWWSTNPRMVLMIDEFKISESLKKTMRKVRENPMWMCRFDSAFEEVMRSCASPRLHQSGTWISEEIISGYTQLHQLGFAHSIEMWFNNELVGGAYGVCIGKMFYGESMFARVKDASKIALVYLVEFLRSHDVKLIDCQQETAHLATFGARPIDREKFMQHVRRAILEETISNWKPNNTLLEKK